MATILARQHALITRRQLHACGFTDSAIMERVRSGRLHRIRRGVYSPVPMAALSQSAVLLAAVLRLSGTTAVGFDSAASRWNIWNRRVDGMHLTSSTAQRAIDGIELTRTRHLEPRDIVLVRKVPTTTVSRTICDMSSRASVHGLVNMMHEAEFRNCFSASEFAREAVRLAKRPKMSRVPRALDLHAAGGGGTTNASEDRFLELVDTAGIPEPLVGHWVRGANDRYRLDTYWPRVRWNCEVDGGPHSRKGTQRDDRARHEDLASAGNRIDRFPTTIIWSDPDWVIRRLQCAWSELCAVHI